jgi:hypothetical protein
MPTDGLVRLRVRWARQRGRFSNTSFATGIAENTSSCILRPGQVKSLAHRARNDKALGSAEQRAAE